MQMMLHVGCLAWMIWCILFVSLGVDAVAEGFDHVAPAPTASPGSKFLWLSHTPMTQWTDFGGAELTRTDDGGLIAAWIDASGHHAEYIWPCGRVTYVWNVSSIYAVHSRDDMVALTGGSGRGGHHALIYNLSNGVLISNISTGSNESILSVTITSGGSTLVITTRKWIGAFGLRDGVLLWKNVDGASFLTSAALPCPAVPISLQQRRIIIVSAGIAIDGATGATVWQAPPETAGAVSWESVTADVTVMVRVWGGSLTPPGFTAVNTSTGEILWTHNCTFYWPLSASISSYAGVAVLGVMNPNFNNHDNTSAKIGNSYPSIVGAVDLLTGPSGAQDLQLIWSHSTASTVSRIGMLKQFINGTVVADELACLVSDRYFHALSSGSGDVRATYGPVQDYGVAAAPIAANDLWDPSVVYFVEAALDQQGNVNVAALKVEPPPPTTPA